MPKMKTKKAAVKRYKVTASGRLQRRQTKQSHLLSKKPSKKKRALSAERTLGTKDVQKVKRLLGLA
jgi:large subunit ribosomal protein L35